jgi:hypothetical protein
MLAATYDSVTELNRAAQRLRLDAGEVVRPIQRVTLADGARGLIGDEVQMRRNDRSLMTDTGVTVKDRHAGLWTRSARTAPSPSSTKSTAE